MIEEEVWKDIPGTGGIYQASNWGRIRSLKLIGAYGFIRDRIKVLSLGKRPDGYLGVSIRVNGARKTMSVHRIIGITFIDNPENLPCINHKNNIRSDNRAINLEWCTSQYNNQYTVKSGRHNLGNRDYSYLSKNKGASHHMSRPKKININGVEMHFPYATDLANYLGCQPYQVSRFYRLKTRKYKNFSFEYIN